MPVYQQNEINVTALQTPDLYVQILSPTNQLIQGVFTNIGGIVGTASWGPKNAPVVIGSTAMRTQMFGSSKARKYDLGTIHDTAVLQGGQNYRIVRVTDGTDTAANRVMAGATINFVSRYTGSLGNSTLVTIGAGSKDGSWRIVVSMPGTQPEVFENVGLGLTGAAVWRAFTDAINKGLYGQRGASSLIVAVSGASDAAPPLGTFQLGGGTDGADGVTPAHLIGVDGFARTGMYALRSSGASVVALADNDDKSTWTLQEAFGLKEGMYMLGVGSVGETITQAIADKKQYGVDSYSIKVLLGDWCYFNDTVNGIVRLVSPQGYALGRLIALSPEQSGLNKPMYGIVATERTMSNMTYSLAELDALGAADIDVITNPIPAGSVFGLRFGRNSSSSAVIHGDNYTRMTNYIAFTLNAAMGAYVGKLQGTKENDPTRNSAKVTVESFLQAMQDAKQIDGYSTQINKANNSDNRIALGYMQMYVKVRYLSVVEYFIIDFEGGQSVQVTKSASALF